MLPPFLMIKNLMLVTLSLIKNKSGKVSTAQLQHRRKAKKATNEYDPGKDKNN